MYTATRLALMRESLSLSLDVSQEVNDTNLSFMNGRIVEVIEEQYGPESRHKCRKILASERHSLMERNCLLAV